MLRLPARLRRQSGKIPVFNLDDKLPPIRRVDNKIGRKTGECLLRSELHPGLAQLIRDESFEVLLLVRHEISR